jgi:hypothetical protein
MRYNNNLAVEVLNDINLSEKFQDTFFLDLVEKDNISKFIQILKDKNTFKVFLLDKSLDEKTYIPNIKISVAEYSDNLITKSLLSNKVDPKVIFFMEFSSLFDGHKFLIEYINFVKLNSLEKVTHLYYSKLKLKIEMLELEYEALNAQLKNLNSDTFTRLTMIDSYYSQLKFKFFLVKKEIDRFKLVKENFKFSSFDFNILNSDYINIKNKNQKLIIDIFLGFLIGLVFSICYLFFGYMIKNQGKSSKIFK